MTLSKKDFCNAIKTFEKLWTDTNKALNYLTEPFINQYLDAYYDLLIIACNFKDKEYLMDIIDWFWVDTNFGHKEDYCGVYDEHTGNTWRITTPEILYDFITRDY